MLTSYLRTDLGRKLDMDKPLIFLGSNTAIQIYSEICEENGISIKGIIDSDYYGNTDNIAGIPVIDSELSFNDPEKLRYYQENFNFFCATNWMPMLDKINQRNREKRHRLLNLIDQYNLNCINIIDRRSKISPSARLGQGILVAEFVVIEPNVVVDNFVNIWTGSMIGHDCSIGRNSVLQRDARLCGNITVEENVYLAMQAFLYKSQCTIGAGSFVHECVYLKRGTIPGEIVSLNGSNMRRVYPNAIHVD